MLALIAGRGRLPVLVAEGLAGLPHRIAVLDGAETDLPEDAVGRRFRIEHLGSFLRDLRAEGVTEVCFAGGIARPDPDAAQVDAATRPLVGRLLEAIGSGDDAALREVIAIFEEAGLRVRAAHEIRPDLLAQDGYHTGPLPPPATGEDGIAHAAEVLRALSPLDIGQSVVVGGGHCLGIETIQGTDALLRFVRNTDPRHRRGAPGLLVKGPKLGQDLRVDMPTIGPTTLREAARAGLGGIVVQAGKTLILDRDAVARAAEEAQVFVQARDLGL